MTTPLSFRRTAAGLALALSSLTGGVSGAGSYDLTPAATPGAASHVTIELTVGGDLMVQDYLSAKESDDPKRAPMSVSARLEYRDRAVTAERSVRRYEVAEATIETAAGRKAPRLARQRRVVIADRSADRRVTLWSPVGPLTRSELDLIDIVGDAESLDRLLPNREVEEGDDWSVGAEAMAALLGLDTVAVCEVSCVLQDGNDRFARFKLAGTVHGAVDAAATEFEVQAIALFDLQSRQVTHLNLAATEKRAIGPATPGLEGTAKVKVRRTPTETPKELSDEALSGLASAGRKNDLVLLAGRQGLRVPHDRGWFVSGEAGDSVTLRRINATGLVAQTTIKRLPAKSAPRQTTPEQFEQEVRFALGGSFGELVSSEQWTNQAGCRVMGLVARGKTKGVSLEWRYYLILPPADAGDDARHQVSLTTTIEAEMDGDAGVADRELADRLQLIKPTKEPTDVATLTSRRPWR